MENIDNLLKDFETFNFPLFSDIVYIIGIQDKDNFIPFYVGESTRHIGRMGDYISAQFNAPTDFRVGEAIKYIKEKGVPVVCRFKATKNRGDDQDEYIKEIKSLGFQLLNDFPAFDPKVTSPEIERERIRKFVQDILDNLAPR